MYFIDYFNFLVDNLKTSCILASTNKTYNIMKNLKINLELIIKIVVVAFILVTLVSVTIAAFSDLTLLNRSF